MITHIFKKEYRPVRLLNFEGKVVFPHPVCQEEAVFLQLNELQHHHKIRHLAALFHAESYRIDRLLSARTKKKLYGNDVRNVFVTHWWLVGVLQRQQTSCNNSVYFQLVCEI